MLPIHGFRVCQFALKVEVKIENKKLHHTDQWKSRL